MSQNINGGGGGSRDDEDAEKVAEEVRSVKQRVQKMEESRQTQPPAGSFSPQDVLSPISRVVERTIRPKL
jgi:hypothetical protein